MKAKFQILNNNFSPALIEGDIVEAVRVKSYEDLQGVYVIKEADRVYIRILDIDSSLNLSLVLGIYRIDRLVSRSLIVGEGCMWLE